MDQAPVLVWLRQDLRLADNAALAAAIDRGGPVVLAYVLDDWGPWPLGSASRWWLHNSLARLAEAVSAKGGMLVLRKGRAEDELPRLAAEIGAAAVQWNRRYEPHERERERRVGKALAGQGVEARDFPGNLLFEPGSVVSREGRPFQVFTAFWRCALGLPTPAAPLPAPERIPAPARAPASLPLEALELLPKIAWWRGMADAWLPGEEGARTRLAEFLGDRLDNYAAMRDRPELPATSRLSPHLTFGEISPRQVWHAVAARSDAAGAETFLKELGWREFSYALLAAQPDLPDKPLKREFADFPWVEDEAGFDAWRQGLTGYPIVDAGMRQLWQTG
ncbi:MAG TPA: deoxyribodipyrimidine photo-lyase, partial [Candidatus Omnitrophota bacterium]|nr:deoxyribodipyrimidine photo-lyase [Candidatus Omnitrophota bacterium]